MGQGIATILSRNAEEITRRTGRHIEVTHAAVRDVAKAQGVVDSHALNVSITDNAASIVSNPDIDIVCEVMGGEQPALDLSLTALAHGKHLVTANKALVAMHGNTLFAAAQKYQVMFGFEPAVAGGIPVIKAIREGLAANRVQSVVGIINGTGNFILTAMSDQGRDFDDVLDEAQALGYAEADPSFDVDGIDAAHKLAILAAIAFGMPLKFDELLIEGIRAIQQEDVVYAKELGYVVKHLGVARRRETEAGPAVELRVHPTLIPQRQLLANVHGVMNAVLVDCDALGQTLYYGPGAGSEPTGSAAVADITDMVRALSGRKDSKPPGSAVGHILPPLGFQTNALIELPVLTADDIETGYYCRITAEDKSGVMASIAGIFARHNISLEAIRQQEPDALNAADESTDTLLPIVLLSHRVREAVMRAAIAEVEALASVPRAVTLLRVETL